MYLEFFLQKQVEKLDQLLHKEYVVKALDRNTDAKAKDSKQKLFAWDNIFKVSCSCHCTRSGLCYLNPPFLIFFATFLFVHISWRIMHDVLNKL